MAVVMWFRRDLRLADNPALLAAATSAEQSGQDVLPLFVAPGRLGPGQPRAAYLAASLASLSQELGGLHVRTGDADEVLAALSAEIGPLEVHAATGYTPRAVALQDRVRAVLAGAGGQLVLTGGPYAVAPGRVTKPAGGRYQVFTPFFRAWLHHGWRRPPGAPAAIPVHHLPGGHLPDWAPPPGMVLPEAGEGAAAHRWRDFLATGLAGYPHRRDRPDLPGTSGLSVALRFGEVHPRTLLAGLADTVAENPELADHATTFARELAWREFFADILWSRPETLTTNLNASYDRMVLDDGPHARAAFARWAQGRTGYPLVDAGMRQLLSEGLMHNRVRMVVASFLVKDLHLPWWLGAEHFMRLLLDGDLASNTHNWQWVAGTGADAAPYFRIFNPVGQGLKHDPNGDYVRRYLPELAHLAGAAAHRPWDHPQGYSSGYPQRMVDHDEERREALERYKWLRS